MAIETDLDRLRRKSAEVKDWRGIPELASQLMTGLGDSGGPGSKAMGLSAIQIGVPKRVLVMRMPDRSPACLVNPVISKRRGSQVAEEGCLSLPGKTVKIRRATEVVVKGQNQYGAFVKYHLNGLFARVAQHEIDHFDGVLIIDRCEGEQK